MLIQSSALCVVIGLVLLAPSSAITVSSKQLTISGSLPVPGPAQEYGVWLEPGDVRADVDVTVAQDGKFTVVVSDVLDSVDTVEIVLQPIGATVKAPTTVLSGTVSSNVGSKTTMSPQPVVSAAAGAFFLWSFTEVAGSESLPCGVWFFNDTGASQTATLELPVPPPTGWVYEGWLQSQTLGIISTGRFTDVFGADSDGAGPQSGTNFVGSVPLFPGQELVVPPTSLASGFTTFITLEPETNDGLSNSGFRVLSASITSNTAGTKKLQLLNANSAATSGSIEFTAQTQTKLSSAGRLSCVIALIVVVSTLTL